MTGIRSVPVRSAVVAASVVIGLSACGSAGTASTATATTAPPSTPTATPSATSAGITAVASPPRCHTGGLAVSDDPDAGGGAAGQHGEWLVFVNTSGHACRLRGYPGVSFVAGDAGRQVGSAFTRIKAETPSTTLSPGGRSYALILLADPDNVDRADCTPTQVRGYRVYPPDETAAVFVAKPQTACAATGKAVGQVRPVAAHESV